MHRGLSFHQPNLMQLDHPDLGGFEQFYGECAIKTVAEWQRSSFRSQPQAPRLRKQTSNDLFIFFRLKAACAVNQYAVGLKELERSARDDKLLVGHPGEVSRSQAPFHVNAASYDSGVRARRIDEHTIEWRDYSNFLRNIVAFPVVANGTDNGCLEAQEV